MQLLLSDRKDSIETYRKKENKTRAENIRFLSKVSQKLTMVKQKLINDIIEESKNERTELKNFNRRLEFRKAEANSEMRNFMGFNR